jgi:hypothetical protein
LAIPYLNATIVSAHHVEVSPPSPKAPTRHWSSMALGSTIAKDLAIPRNITPMRLPAYAPELCPIENVWEY